MSLKPRVFLSRTTKGLATLADKIAVVLDEMGYEVIHQPDFTMSWRKIRHMLMEKLRASDAVLCLIGPAYGFAPKTPIPEFRDLDTGREAFSYTQLEYLIARRLHRPVFTILVPEHCDTFPLDAFTQDDTERDLQREFIQDIIKARKNEHPYYDERSFPTHDALLAKLRDALHGLTALPPSHPENIPFPSIGKVFTGRADTLRDLRETLVAAGSERPAVQVLHGMGGVGKTRVTVEYAHTFQHDYTARLFVTGNSPGALDGALANLAGIFLLNLEEQDEKENDIRIAAVLRWLAQHPGWLLVIDNVDTPEARDHALHIVSQLPPGHVLITTRIHTWPGHFLRTPLDVLSDTDGRDLLLAYRSSPKAEAEDTDAADALLLAHDLDGLALALEQAAAYLNQIAITIAEYHQRWKANAERVKEWTVHEKLRNPEQGETEENKLRVSVATTWLTSFEQLTPAAQSLLKLLAWLAPDPIPRFLLKPLAEKKLQPDPLNGTDPYLALGNLTDFSLAKPDRKGVAFSVHRLIQEIARERQEPPIPADALSSVLCWLNGTYPEDSTDFRTWPLAVHLTPHAIASGMAGATREMLIPLGSLLNRCGLFCNTRADFRNAEVLFQKHLLLCKKQFGSTSPEVAMVLNSLAGLFLSTGRFEDAERHCSLALSCLRGAEQRNLSTYAVSISNLAQVLQATNRLPLAEQLMWQSLIIDEAIFGDHHPKVATRLNNLAHLLQATNRSSEAEPLIRRAMDIDIAFYGMNHPEVATDITTLTNNLFEQGRLNEAEPLMRRALSIHEECFGDAHPKTAVSLNNLANVLQFTNRLSEAEGMRRRALAIDEAVLGRDHPDVARDLSNLASLLSRANRFAEAEPLQRRAVNIGEVAMGKDHPMVASLVNGLAVLLMKLSRLAEAEPLMKRAVEMLVRFTRSTGHEHPHLYSTLENYQILLEKMGESPERVMSRLREFI